MMMTQRAHTADVEPVFMIAFFAATRFDMAHVFSRILRSDFGDRQPILTVDHVILGVRVIGEDVEVRVVVALEDVERGVRFPMRVRWPVDANWWVRRRVVVAADGDAVVNYGGQLRHVVSANSRRQNRWKPTNNSK